ncbi:MULTISPECIES: glycosyltransferase family 2 protein [Caulobacter]|jgi:glycosyltransferase involved in cell wall biosynthesis|uniref:Glycosyl transferase n=1 Tax=Caulobacter vibrioides OR37 TaxID=1292034 RepID=R0D3P7_CAUVI|nr:MULTISPECIES: glycosyltransferase family 2 protein [Caulobacter]ENZ83211.1 glycosyl transferase [Caulobacter vibrioides OR37]MBQ1561916.1 glycosyltransferase family 2 protein [Caulobacter sp.]
MAKLSALICVHNEEQRLPACLAALSFCDEIVVVADRCSDGTEAIARQYGAVVVSGIFPIEGPRKHAGIARCTGDWILELDADEGVTPAFAQEIRDTVERADAADWYQIPIDNYVGDQLVRHGWGGSFGTASAARLFRRGMKSWKAERVHPGAKLDGVSGGRLTQPLRHMVDEDIADMFARLGRYTALKAQDLADSGKIKSVGDDAFRGVRRFFKCYVSRKGYKEGELGFLIALMAALYPILSNLRAREILRTRAKASLAETRPAPAPTRLPLRRVEVVGQ